MGGESSEREVSLLSGKNVLNSLVELGFKVKSLDCSGNLFPN